MGRIIVEDFNLSRTLESGQFFNYFLLGNNKYAVIDGDSVFEIEQKNNKLFFRGNVSEEHIFHLFSLDAPYKDILDSISKDNHIRRAVYDYYGLRVMRQDLWQCTVSFICSAVSNVPRIRENIISLSRLFGGYKAVGNRVFHTFPSFNRLKKLKEETIAKAGMGFRAKYVKSAAEWFSEGNWENLKGANHDKEREDLMEIKGVGRKIAECICLFSLGFDDAFPVDVWIKREMERLYFKGESIALWDIEDFGREYFGKYCGWAQQYLFHNARTKTKTFS